MAHCVHDPLRAIARAAAPARAAAAGGGGGDGDVASVSASGSASARRASDPRRQFSSTGSLDRSVADAFRHSFVGSVPPRRARARWWCCSPFSHLRPPGVNAATPTNDFQRMARRPTLEWP